ncbi:MAG: low molecular weight protein arginine phosphatase [Clostridia bacterium]|nr:low molecular weight protein arginine phosphatase [Clostridia bacterium]
MVKIMFVCTGNICRSPMAHYYMQSKVKELGLENEFLISSCGTYAINGERSTDNAILSMKAYDVDLTPHRATNIGDTDIGNYDFVITLTVKHKNDIINYYKELKDKTFTLKEFVNDDVNYKDVDDPWGLNIMVYKDTAKEIVENVDKLIQKLLRK